DVYFHKSVEAGGVLAIVVGKGDIARMLSYGGKIIKDLEREVNKKIRVLEYNSDERKFLEDLFAPMSILTINKIWLPDGTTETRVVLKRGRRMKPQVKMKSLKKIAKKLYDMSLRIEFAS
ncbi:MAG: transcription elongation factor NusA, partial [Candidatus Bathyarchaeota archaeon B26-2]